MVFSPSEGYRDRPVSLPCGKCIGCRRDRARAWSIRCVHEAQLHEHNCFVTLTYDNEHLPSDYSVNPHHFQLFMKTLRQDLVKVAASQGKRSINNKPVYPVRYFHVGEYGEQNYRPHYHALLFGIDFPDKVKIRARPHPLFESDVLTRMWGRGRTTLGAVTQETAAYCARYTLKKVTGEAANEHYKRTLVDEDTGECTEVRVKPEYATMSRNPGIGAGWYDRFREDVYPEDTVIHAGKGNRPPRFYDERLREEDPFAYHAMKEKRRKALRELRTDRSPERLKAREESAERTARTVERRL